MIIDVSKWQKAVNFLELKNDPQKVTGVYIKATEGVGYVDPFAKANALEAFKNGFQVGYYHFASLNTSAVQPDAVAEANAFINAIKSFGVKPTLPIVLDIEKNDAKLPAATVLAWIKTFFAELQRLGYTDIAIYSYTPFLNANLPLAHGLGAIKLWLAAYTPTPVIPHGWVGYWLWQYTSKGVVKGIGGNVDLNKS